MAKTIGYIVIALLVAILVYLFVKNRSVKKTLDAVKAEAEALKGFAVLYAELKQSGCELVKDAQQRKFVVQCNGNGTSEINLGK